MSPRLNADRRRAVRAAGTTSKGSTPAEARRTSPSLTETGENPLALLPKGAQVFPIWPTKVGEDGERYCTCSDDECDNAGKHPALKWTKYATASPAHVRRWREKYPGANFGVACGPSGIVVLDEDEMGEFQRLCEADEGEREVIRLVVGWLVRDGMSTGEVADRLNDLGMPPRKGGRWLYEVVKKTFTNSVLCDGVRVWGTPGAERGGRHTRMDRNGKPVHGDPVVTVLPDPPLSRDEFEAVVAALTRRGNGRPRTGTTSRELTGRLYGDCGRHYTGVRLSHADRFVYRCTGRRHRGVGAPRCSCPQVDATTVEDAVWEQVVALLSNPARLRSLAGEWLALAGAGEDSTADLEFERLAKQVARLERAKINAAREVLLADDPKPYRAALAQVEQELASLQPRLDAATAAREDAAARAERLTDLASLAARAAQRLPSMSHEQRARVLVLLDVKVTMRGVVRGVPQVVEVTGRVDPRLFGPGDEDGSGGGGGQPGGDGGSGAPGTRPDGGARPGGVPHPADHRGVRRLPVARHPEDRALIPCLAPTRPAATTRHHPKGRTMEQDLTQDRRPERPAADDPERGDVPGWVLVTLMTAGLVVALWAVAGPLLEETFTRAISSVTGS